MAGTTQAARSLRAHVPDLLTAWTPSRGEPRHMRVEGSLVFVDISGFTTLTERLARHGHVGSEEMSDLLDATFGALLRVARDEGGDLVKWGGDAVLLLFQDEGHPVRAVRAARDMRDALRTVGTVRSTAGTVRLRMSVGVHSAPIDFYLVGDPSLHRELLVVGPAATRTAALESAATAGQVVLSDRTARSLPDRHLRPGPIAGSALLLSRPGGAPSVPVPRGQADGSDFGGYLPAVLRDHLLAEAGEAEHRTVTVAFLRFSGTDALTRRGGTGRVAEALDACVRVVQSAAASHGVTFLETDIDRDGFKVMLVAGAPRTTGHDEERMVRTLRTVVEAAPPLTLQAGVNRGHVFTGGFGPDFRRTFSVKGDAVNLAARLMAKAGPGDVLAAPDVLDRSETRFHAEELEPFRVKGKSAPVRAARVGAAGGRRETTTASTRFVGRDHELAVLRDALAGAADGFGRQVEVVGEPGIGKSRLVEEALAGRPDVPVVRGPCDEYESSTAYFPFRRLLREALGLAPDATGRETLERLVQVVDEQGPDLRPWLPLLGLPLDLDLPPTPETADLDEQFRKSRLEQAVVDLLERLLPGPAALLVEDAQLMDDASAALLDALARRVARRPWLLVVTRRDHAAGYLPRPGPDLLTLPVGELTTADRSALADTVAGERPIAPEVLAQLVARSGGNPLFLEALLQDAGRRGGTAELPESVEGLVTSQVDRLAPLERTVLRYAAVLGVTVERDVLDTLLTEHLSGTSLDQHLPRLNDFLVSDGPGRLRFRHALMRDVAYEGLPYRRRRPLHAQVAGLIERDVATPESRCEILSFHFFQAGHLEQAWRYSLLAGGRARRKFANAEAEDFFRRAVECARRGAPVGLDELAMAHESLGDVCFLLGSVSGAAEAFARARRLVRADPVRVAELVVKQARVDQRQREFPRSLRRLARAMDRLDGLESAGARRARSALANRAAQSRFSQGRVDAALRWGMVAAREAEDAADKAALAQAYAVLNAIAVAAGRREELPYGRMALRAYAELGDLAGQAHCLNNLAVRALAEGRWASALADFRRAAEIFGRLGDAASAANATFNQADVLVRQGRLEEAEPLLGDARRMAVLVEDEELEALVDREAGRVHARSGRFAEAEACFTEAAEHFSALGEDDEVAEVAICRAEAALFAGDPTESLRLTEPLRADGSHARADLHRVAGFALLRLGRLEEADAALQAGLALVPPTGPDYERGLLLLGRAQVALILAKPQAVEHELSGRNVLERLGVVATPFSTEWGRVPR